MTTHDDNAAWARISRRKFGPMHVRPCFDPAVKDTCARFACQRSNRCQYDATAELIKRVRRNTPRRFVAKPK